MPHIAVLGATSQIAKDLIAVLAPDPGTKLSLFARNSDAVRQWAAGLDRVEDFEIAGFDAFGRAPYDIVINFVGVGDPARLIALGANIFDITLEFDQLALEYVRNRPQCRYIFLSSGAVYGSTFLEPATEDTPAVVPINAIAPENYYAVAKLHAESRHRSLSDHAIIDLRVFNYFSRTQDLEARFFISEIVKAIHSGGTLVVSPQPMVRDFLHPSDFHRLIVQLMRGQPGNQAVDCYTRAPVEKKALLVEMEKRFGLRYRFDTAAITANATGSKPNYYSLNRRAATFGYQPQKTSLDGLIEEVTAILER